MAKRFFTSFLPCALFFVALCTLCAQTKSRMNQRVLVITHVTVIDTTGGPARSNETVIVHGDRITEEGRSGRVRIPSGSQTVDASGKFLIPGLWDMHVHLNYKDYLPLFIANGVTGVRVMWGDPEHSQWRKQIDDGQLLGPRMMIGSAIIDGPNPYWRGSISVANETQARQAVDEAKRDGADFVKIYQFLPRDLYLDIADEAKKQAIPFAGHVPISVTAEEASFAGQKSFEHLVGVLPACSTRSTDLEKAAQADFVEDLQSRPKFWGTHTAELRDELLQTYSPQKAAALSAVFKKNGTWQCPTLTLWHMFAYGDGPAFLNDPRLKYVPPAMKAGWDPAHVDNRKQTAEDFAYLKREFLKNLEVVGTMQRSGVGILAGTDAQNPYSFYGFSLHDELGFLVDAGLSPMQALQAATINPARFFGKEKDLGSIEKGKLADLVLLDGNPLVAIANTKKIDAVVYRGEWFPKASLDAMLAKAEALASRKLIGPVLLQTLQEKGVQAAIEQYRDLKATQPDGYDFSEEELIRPGYQLIKAKKYSDAIEIFKLAVETYPESYNTYDSLGEAYMDNGDKELAIKNYEKSIEINPKNANGIKMLTKLKAE
jgi:tetratricopeptide (TPR) repeat protein